MNGAVERANGTWRYEFYACYDLPYELPALNQAIDSVAHLYNHHRPHRALNGHTPAESLQSIAASNPRSLTQPEPGHIIHSHKRVVVIRSNGYLNQIREGLDMRKIGILAVAAAAVSLAGVLPRSAVADEHPIVIGFAIALSGWMEQYDQGSRFAEFAIEEINAKGGLLGRQLTTIYADNKTDPAQSARAGIDVVAKDADLVIVSCDYDIGGPAALIAQNAGKISFSLCAEDPKMGIEGVGPLSFTASSAAQVQAASMAEWAHQEKGFRSAYSLINVATEWGKSLCHGFKYTWERLPGTTYLGEDTFKHEDTNFAAQITRIKNLSQMPDAIMICGFPPSGATAVRQIRAAGIDTAILSGQGMDGEFWLESVPNLSSFYLTTIASLYGDDPNAKLEGLSKRFEGQYGERPATAYIFPGYALIELWARAVELAGTTDAQAVVDELNKFRNEPTLLGPRSFSKDLHIQVQAQYLIMQIQDGKYSRIGYWTNSEPISQDLLFRR